MVHNEKEGRQQRGEIDSEVLRLLTFNSEMPCRKKERLEAMLRREERP